MTITLGFSPYSIEVVLAYDSVFTAAIVADDPWPPDVRVELRLSTGPNAVPIVWPATVEQRSVTWEQPEADVAAAIRQRATHARLVYITAEGDDLLWAVGRVRHV